MRAGFGHVPRHVGQPDPARSINGPCLARPYSYRAETGSGRVRAGWPVWTSILGHGQGYTPEILTLKLDGDGEGATRQGVDDDDGERRT